MTLVQERKATLVAKRVLNTLTEINNQLNDIKNFLESSTNFSAINRYHKEVLSLICRANFYFKVADNLIAIYRMDWKFDDKDNYTLGEYLSKELNWFKSFMKIYFK